MVASLLRVLHSGIQDSRLLPPKGKPNVELFSRVLIRAGRFTTQWVRLDFDTRPAFGTKSVITIPRKGHLVARLYLVTTMPDIDTTQAAALQAATQVGNTFLGPYYTWTNSLGHAILQQATVEIGGVRVEQIDGQLLEVLDEFYTPLEKLELANTILQRNMTNFPQFPAATTGVVGNPVTAITPLPFWFSKGDPGVYLPIDALAADPVKLTIQLSPLSSLYVSSAQRSIATAAAGGDGYFPLAYSQPFYMSSPTGNPVFGLGGDPTKSVNAAQIPGVRMPELLLGDSYIMAEYVYLDAPEANRFRISDIEVPVTQHYAFDPYDTKGASKAAINLRIPNPVRNIFFYAQRYEATFYNAPFLATRDLSGSDATAAPWWPNAVAINSKVPGLIQPAFVFRDSEPISGIQLNYEGSLVRYSTTSPSLFRSFVPSYEMKKSPFINRYYYTFHFGLNHGGAPPSLPCGEANLDIITTIDLQLEFKPFRGYSDLNAVPRYIVHVWAESYNVFRVYAGRGGLMFAY
jgi:hypothetical protein